MWSWGYFLERGLRCVAGHAELVESYHLSLTVVDLRCISKAIVRSITLEIILDKKAVE